MNFDLETLAALPRRVHDDVFARGTAPAVEELVGWDFAGWNCSLLPRLGGFQKFVKGFFHGDESPNGGCEGWNAAVIQNGIDGEWLGLPDDDHPRRFGFYRVAPFPAGGLLLDYGAHSRNRRLDPSRALRDLLVRVDGDPDLFLGKAHLALGRWVFAGHFILRRRRRVESSP